ncbi:LptF/LptG family permease [Spirochaeta cellobiosiphila]|uniref:LptF/LptG family permease n=1 Tax=Spirochaeta cellobiosiphila TaxID=504483 RepID=UPI00040C61A7|nr:LptF/LptG family permease [Spirochaeta cellobiosiphila]
MILQKMLLKKILPVFIVAVFFFVTILELLDLFTNLWRYLQNEVNLVQVAYLALLYLPKCVSFSLPVALLFAVSFSLGDLYANNELIAVFGSGVSLLYLTIPVFILGLLISVTGLIFDNYVVIPTYKNKNNLSRELLHQQTNYSNSNVIKMSQEGRIVYFANYYNDKTKTLSGLIYLERNSDGTILRRIDADYAEYRNTQWTFNKARVFLKSSENEVYFEEDYDQISEEKFNEDPEVFKKQTTDIDEMNLTEAKEYIHFLQKGNLPYKVALTDYYNRFAFAFTPFIVAFISCALGGRFKKNILLMSLLSSLIIGVGYYVIQLVTVIMAKLDILPPAFGAWFGVIFVFIFGVFLFSKAKT